jgi:putative heme-binding domain-containing protein
VGPDLTGSYRANLDYLLSYILDPCAVIDKEYQPYVILTEDGRVITGLLKEESPTALVLQSSTELVTIPRDEIEEMRQSEKSMMPDNLLANLSESEVRALVSYLASSHQISLRVTEETASLLFNGTDLANWRCKEGLWNVEDGQLVGKSNGLSRNEFLISDLIADDFHLKLEVKLVNNQGNSGIQFRSREIDNREVQGYQADIGQGWWGKLYEEHGRGLLWDKPGDDLIRPGQWTTYEIRAEGSKIQTWIDGKLAVDINDPDGDRQGVFALQLHSGGPMEIRFRKFELTPISRSIQK